MIFINVKMFCGLRSGCKQELILCDANQKLGNIYVISGEFVAIALMNLLQIKNLFSSRSFFGTNPFISNEDFLLIIASIDGVMNVSGCTAGLG